MTHFEYKIVGFENWGWQAAQALTGLGEDGWKVIDVTSERYSTKALLERPVYTVVRLPGELTE